MAKSVEWTDADVNRSLRRVEVNVAEKEEDVPSGKHASSTERVAIRLGPEAEWRHADVVDRLVAAEDRAARADKCAMEVEILKGVTACLER